METPLVADDEWDAGGLGCGELVIALRRRLKAMPGGLLRLTAEDPAAPHDLPAYCRLTGNALVHHDPASRIYWIRSKTAWP